METGSLIRKSRKGSKLTDEFNFSSRSAHICEFLGGLAAPSGCSPGLEDIGEGQGRYGSTDGRTGDRVLPTNIEPGLVVTSEVTQCVDHPDPRLIGKFRKSHRTKARHELGHPDP